MKLKFKLLKKTAKLPVKAHLDDAGFDLFLPQSVKIAPSQKALIELGISSQIPKGHFVLIKDRSSVALSGLHLLAGVIDAGYRGEWKIIAVNLGKETLEFRKGDKIAQGILLKLPEFQIEETRKLDESERLSGGFGSTGR